MKRLLNSAGKSHIRKVIKKSDPANAISLMAIPITLIAVISFFLFIFSTVKKVNTRADIDNITHYYLILCSEKNGLTGSDIDAFVDSLEILGVKDIDTSGTSLSESPGDYLYVSFKGKLKGEDIEITKKTLKRKE